MFSYIPDTDNDDSVEEDADEAEGDDDCGQEGVGRVTLLPSTTTRVAAHIDLVKIQGKTSSPRSSSYGTDIRIHGQMDERTEL